MNLEVYEYLLAAYGSTLAIATVKGYPSWGKPEVTTPCVAMEFNGWLPGPSRVGQIVALGNTAYQGWLFCRDEPELVAKVDALTQWHMEHGAFDIAAKRVACSLLNIKRHVPETTALQETHGATFLVQATW